MLRQETLNYISKTIEDAFGMTYEEFSKLDCDEQQRLISAKRKKQKKKNFLKLKKGERIMIGSGEHSCFVSGISPEEERQRLEDDLDDIIYNKPVAFIKKLQRRIKNR